jgi:hypothetical protein
VMRLVGKFIRRLGNLRHKQMKSTLATENDA